MTRPKIFLLGVGCQRGGSSWLHRQFQRSSSIDLGFRKEYHVFDSPQLNFMPGLVRSAERSLGPVALQNVSSDDDVLVEILDSFRKNPDEYFAFFDNLWRSSQRVTVVGDLTPAYAGLPAEAFTAIRNWAHCWGFTVRVIFIMRDPFERIWSQVRMHRRNYLQRYPHRTINSSEPEHLLRHYADHHVEFRTRYENTIANLEVAFDSDSIYYGFYESLFTEDSISAIAQFLGLDSLAADFRQVVNSTPRKQTIDPEIIRIIGEYYRDTYRFCFDRFGADSPIHSWIGYRYLSFRD